MSELTKTDVTNLLHFKNFCNEIVTKIKEIRSNTGMTQDDVAQILGVSRRKINELESGVNLDFELLLKYADFFSIEINYYYKQW